MMMSTRVDDKMMIMMTTRLVTIKMPRMLLMISLAVALPTAV